MNTIINHKFGGISAILLILIFQISTIISEVFLGINEIRIVKELIVYAIPFLIISIIITGKSGAKISGNRINQETKLKKKQFKMKIIALNGMFILLPSAMILFILSKNATISSLFWVIQIIEICFGLLNLTLLIQNAIIGIKFKKRIKSLAIALAFTLMLPLYGVTNKNIKGCVSYIIKKDVAIIASSTVVGKNCSIQIKVVKTKSIQNIFVSIPVQKFNSGNNKRDKHVQELLGKSLTFQAALPVPFSINSGIIKGHLFIKGKMYKVPFNFQKNGNKLRGEHSAKLTDFGITPPETGPGGIIAKAHNNIKLIFEVEII